MPKLKYLIRKIKFELITATSALLGYLITYEYFKKPELLFILSTLITLIATVIIIHVRTKDKHFYFLSLQNSVDGLNFIGEGTFQYERVHNAYMIKYSPSGFIFAKCLTWSDYELNFDFKIINFTCGVIVRALNLSNLIMLQISEFGIRPHIRINGFWKVIEANEARLVFENKISLDNWYKCRLKCDKNSIRIQIKAHKKKNFILDREWNIISGVLTYEQKADAQLVLRIEYPINLEYGTFGFRNMGEERALIRNVLIEKIEGIKSVDN